MVEEGNGFIRRIGNEGNGWIGGWGELGTGWIRMGKGDEMVAWCTHGTLGTIMAEFRTFKDLECWKACRELRMFVADKVLPALPKDEKYRLGDQLVRASRSTTANIAEGYGRFHYLDTAKFVSNARGSAYETLDHLITAHDENILSPLVLQEGEGLVQRAIKLLNGYIRYLQELSRTTSSVHETQAGYSCSTSSQIHTPFPNETNEPIVPPDESPDVTNETNEPILPPSLPKDFPM